MKKKMFIFLIAVALLAPVFPATAAAQSADEAQAAKIAIESHLEAKLKSAIEAIAGTDKIIASVNIDLTRRSRGGSGSSQKRGVLTERRSRDALVLPGVPEKKEIGKGQTQVSEVQLPAPSGPSGDEFGVRRLSATVFVDDGVSERTLAVVREVAAKVVGYDAGRGDELEVKRLNFSGRGPNFLSFLQPPDIYWLVIALSGAFFLVSAATYFIRPSRKASARSLKIDVDSSKGGLITGGGAPQAAHGGEAGRSVLASPLAAASEDAEKTPSPFSFIKEGHNRDLAFILRNEPAADVATVINYMEPGLATRLFEYFPEERQVEIAVYLNAIKEVSPGEISRIEERIKDRLGYLIGGEDKVADILGMAGDEVRKKVIGRIQAADAAAAARLTRKSRDFEAVIRDLSAEDIQVLSRHVDSTVFAQVLKSSPQAVQDKVLGSFSAGAREMLKQNMDLSRPLPASRLKNEKYDIMLAIRRLARDGLIGAGGL